MLDNKPNCKSQLRL